MSFNRFGHMFAVMTFGESHGRAIGCVIDGCPPGLPISEADIQHCLDQRKPGTSKFVTQRREDDTVQILSGVFPDPETGGYLTTGTPIALVIENTDQRSKDYSLIKNSFRPGHADYTYFKKYGIRDYRGGGRSSARETACRVAAGAVARKVIPNIVIRGAVVEIGGVAIDRTRFDWTEVSQNPFFAPDAKIVPEWEALLNKVRKEGSSVGAVIEVVAEHVPVGLGAPVYGKLDSDLALAMMSINAVKGVEIGDGFQAARLSGIENADEMRMGDNGQIQHLANHSGGILGGISNGEPIVVRFAVKPTSSILTPRQSVNSDGENVDIATHGRHDPCVGIRAVPVGEAMMALVLADHVLRHRGQNG